MFCYTSFPDKLPGLTIVFVQINFHQTKKRKKKKRDWFLVILQFNFLLIEWFSDGHCAYLIDWLFKSISQHLK